MVLYEGLHTFLSIVVNDPGRKPVTSILSAKKLMYYATWWKDMLPNLLTDSDLRPYTFFPHMYTINDFTPLTEGKVLLCNSICVVLPVLQYFHNVYPQWQTPFIKCPISPHDASIVYSHTAVVHAV